MATKTAPDSSGIMVMDKAWEKIQKKTFTKWVNSHLTKRGQAITEIDQEFKDGLKFLVFLEIIGNHQFSKYEKKPKIRIQMIQNVGLGLAFLKEAKVPLVGISAEEIVDGNQKLILGMIWTIIQRFQINDISEEELSAKDALLLWCKKKTAGYRDCKVENFHTSWQDGMAFCALIHKHRPDLIDYDSLKKDNAKENLQLAFDVAEKHLGIMKLLDVEDMIDVPRPDERSVITYVSQFYHAFSSNKKQENAGRRIGKLIDMNATNEQMKADYSVNAQAFVDWVNKKIEDLNGRDFPNDLEGVKGVISDFNSYKHNEKPPKAAEKLDLEALFNSIAIKLRSNNKDPFVPPTGTSPSDIAKLWETLGQAEKEREDALQKELERQQKLDLLKKRFNNKADKFEAWIAAKQKYLNKDETVESLNNAKEKIRQHNNFYDEYSSSKARLDELQAIAEEIASLNDSGADSFKERVAKISDNWNGLKGSADSKKQDLQKKLEIQERMEQLRFDFAKLAKEYNRWVGSSIDEINNHSFGESLEDVESYKQEMDSNDSQVTQQSNEKQSVLDKLWEEMQQLGVTDIKYTVLTIKDIHNRNAQVEEALKKRQEEYQNELKRQLEMEEKRKEFAKVAQEFIDHLTARKQEIKSLLSGGEPEQLIETINATYNDGVPEKEKLDAISQLNAEMSDMGINDNKHTEYNVSILSKKKDQFANSVNVEVAELIEEKELKAEFTEAVKDFIEWINSTIPTLKERGFDNTLEGAQKQSAEFSQYKTGKKAEQAAKKPNIELLYNNIVALLKKNNRPEFQPTEEYSLNTIEKLWTELESEEAKKEEDLQNELQRQEKLAYLVRRFKSDAEDLESWVNSKEKFLNEREESDSLFNAQFNMKLYEAYTADVKNRENYLSQLSDLRNEIKSLNYYDVETIDARFDKLSDLFTNLKGLGDSKKTHLQEQLKAQQDKENLRIEFARSAKEFNEWVKKSTEDIRDYNFGFTLDHVTAYKEELTKSDLSFTEEATQKKNQLEEKSNELKNAGVTENRHTKITMDDINSFSNLLTEEISKRQTAYQNELTRQQNAEEKRKEFAGQATGFVTKLTDERQTLEKVEGTPDEKVEKINSIHNKGEGAQADLNTISALSSDLRSQNIHGNSHTKYTLPALISKNNLHNNYVNNLTASYTEEKELEERIKNQEIELAAKEKLENLIVEFSTKARELNTWMENTSELLDDPLNATSLQDAEKFNSEHQQFEKEKAEKQALFQELTELANTMQQNGITDFSGVTIEELTNQWNGVQSAGEKRKQDIDEEVKRQTENDATMKNFAEKAQSINDWMETEKNALASSKGALEDQLSAVTAQISKWETVGKPQIKQLEEINQKLETANIKSNRYTNLSFRDLSFQFQQLKTSMEKQDKLLSNEILIKKNGDVTPEQLAEFKEVFQHFDKDNSGALTKLELKSCLQSLGEEHSDAEVDKLMTQFGVDNQITFDNFTTFMISKTSDSNNKEEILESFKALANDKDFVTEEDLRKVLPNDKVDYLLKNMPKYSGVDNGYDYQKWAETATSK